MKLRRPASKAVSSQSFRPLSVVVDIHNAETGGLRRHPLK
jgi:hypothetical protein